jgi:cyclic pyranopterin phosphate synthase
MIDSIGRNIEYLRISITDRCNLRCIYCMPSCGVEQLSHQQVLRFEELLRIARIMAELGIKKLKISGGEPLVRKGASQLIAELKQLPGIEQVTLTSNGVLLRRELPALRAAGLDAINISLDTLDADKYQRITRQGSLEAVLSGLDAAYEAGIRPLKINTVIMRGINDDEIEALAGIAKERQISVRFIELMPIGLGQGFTPVKGEEVLQRLSAAYGKPVSFSGKIGNGPAVYYSFPGFAGKIGLIDAVSHGFCSACNRVRLTSDGWLKLCLHFDLGCDLLTPMRAGATDEEIKKLIVDTIVKKPVEHHFRDQDSEHIESKNMNSIGG